MNNDTSIDYASLSNGVPPDGLPFSPQRGAPPADSPPFSTVDGGILPPVLQGRQQAAQRRLMPQPAPPSRSLGSQVNSLLPWFCVFAGVAIYANMSENKMLQTLGIAISVYGLAQQF